MAKLLKRTLFFFTLLEMFQLHGMVNTRKRKKIPKITKAHSKKVKFNSPQQDWQLSENLKALKTNIHFLPPEILQEIMEIAAKNRDPYQALAKLTAFKLVSKAWKDNAQYLQDKFLEQFRKKSYLNTQPTFSLIHLDKYVVNNLVASHDDKYLACYRIKDYPKTVLLIALQKTEEHLITTINHQHEVKEVCFSPNKLVIALKTEIIFWDLVEKKRTRTLTLPHHVSTVACSKNSLVAIASQCCVNIYNLQSKSKSLQPTEHNSRILKLQFASDNSFLVSLSGKDCIIHTYDQKKQRWIDTKLSTQRSFYNFHISPNNHTIAINFTEGSSILLHKNSTAFKKQIISPDHLCGFTQDNNPIWYTSEDNGLNILQKPQQIKLIKNRFIPLQHFFYLPNPDLIVVLNNKIYLIQRKHKETVIYVPQIKTKEQIQFAIACHSATLSKNIKRLQELLGILNQKNYSDLKFEPLNSDIMTQYISGTKWKIHKMNRAKSYGQRTRF